MINFAVGPVMMDEEIRSLGAQEIPYFRTPEFSALMKENETLMKRFVRAGDGARALFLTGSGTAAMEAAVLNLFTEKDRVLVGERGKLWGRFEKLCQVLQIPHETIYLESGKALKKEHLDAYEGKNFTGFLVNVHETSTGVYYDMDLISDSAGETVWCFWWTPSVFLADDFFMENGAWIWFSPVLRRP